MLFCGMPLVIVTTITVVLVLKLRTLKQRRSTMIRANQPKNNATKVLIVVNIVFIVCTLTWPVTTILKRIGLINIAYTLDGIIVFFHIVNSSVNPLIYGTLSKQYRTVVIQNCPCLRKRADSASNGQNIRTDNKGEKASVNNREAPL